MNRWRNTVRKVSRILLVVALLLMPWGTLFSSVPTPPSCAWFLHVSALAGLTVLSFIAFEKLRQRIGVVIFIFFYSAFLEFLQYFNPARHGTIADLGANALGCLVGLVFWLAASRLYGVVSKSLQETIPAPIKPEEHGE